MESHTQTRPYVPCMGHNNKFMPVLNCGMLAAYAMRLLVFKTGDLLVWELPDAKEKDHERRCTPALKK